MTAKPTIALFAASRLPKDPDIIAAAEALGTALGKAGFDINYGAGTSGLMGKTALAAAAAAAQVNAFVLKRYQDEEQISGAHIVPVDTEQERFARMSTHQNPVAMIMLPGGPGTLREVLQGLEGAVYDQGPPVILVKVGTYLDGIKNYFDLSVAQGMISKEHEDKLQLLTVAEVASFLTQKRNPALAKKHRKSAYKHTGLEN